MQAHSTKLRAKVPAELDKTLRLKAASLRWLETQGEVLALDVEASSYFSANASATLLWRRLAGGATRGDLADEIVTAYGIDPARALHDVDVFLAELDRAGLLDSTA